MIAFLHEADGCTAVPVQATAEQRVAFVQTVVDARDAALDEHDLCADIRQRALDRIHGRWEVKMSVKAGNWYRPEGEEEAHKAQWLCNEECCWESECGTWWDNDLGSEARDVVPRCNDCLKTGA